MLYICIYKYIYMYGYPSTALPTVFLCVICLGAAFLGGTVANGGLVLNPHSKP